MAGRETNFTEEAGVLGVGHHGEDDSGWKLDWTCEKWEQDKVDFVINEMVLQADERIIIISDDVVIPHFIGGKKVFRPRSEGLPSDFLRDYKVKPDEISVVEGNLLLNEGIGRFLDLALAAGGVAFNAANAFIGVGDSATAEAATQVELQAATNRFYKGMVATYPVSPGSNGAQSRDWRSDFTSTEANYAWAEWTICAGATTASGAGFTTGTTNLNRKVQALGTKSTGTWTMTGTVTIS